MIIELHPQDGEADWIRDGWQGGMDIRPFWGRTVGALSDINEKVSFRDQLACNAPWRVSGGAIHRRSAYLGNGWDRRHYFAKGIGCIDKLGWSRDMGSTGILPKWAVIYERDMAIALNKIGIATVRPEAILLYKTIPSPDGTLMGAETIIDLDGTLAYPAQYIYSSSSRWRLADLFFMSECERQQLLGVREDMLAWMKTTCDLLIEETDLLHQAGGHDHSLSAHQVFLDGSRVDFEYVWLPEMNHPKNQDDFAKSVEDWQSKELDGLSEALWQIADLLRVELPANWLRDKLKGV